MSVTLSMISRQLEPSMSIEFQRQSVHSSLADSGISGMRTSGWRRVALVVVPDEQQAAADVGVPRAGAGQPRRALGVGHQLALAVAAPAPVVERAGDLVALDGALGQVAAHVPAVAVEDLELALRSRRRPPAWCRRSRRSGACRRGSSSPVRGSASRAHSGPAARRCRSRECRVRCSVLTVGLPFLAL